MPRGSIGPSCYGLLIAAVEDVEAFEVMENRYDVKLISAGRKPQRVARIVAEFTDRTRPESMEMIESAPVLILQGTSYATAEGARMALERLGATLEVRAYEVESAGRLPQSSTPSTSRLTAWEIVGVGFLVLFIILIILIVIGFLIVNNLHGDPTF